MHVSTSAVPKARRSEGPGIDTRAALEPHPRMGAPFEGFARETVLRTLQVRNGEAYFWATHGGAELDLLVVRKGRRLGFEFKMTDQPKRTRSMHVALADSRLDQLTVVVPGRASHCLANNVDVKGLGDLVQQLTPSLH